MTQGKRYDFDKVIDRRGTDCLKYDFAVERGKPADVLPFWVADMDFAVADEVKEALVQRVQHGIFGYSDSKGGYFDAVAAWYRRNFNWQVQPQWLVKTPGVVFALAMAVQAFTKAGDGVLIQRPVYYPFSQVIEANGRRLVNSPLRFNGSRYEMDLADFERQITENNVKLFILCSPHNPVGRVWSESELRAVGDICLRHGVIVVSDEIHADFTWEGHRHRVFASLGQSYADNCIVCTAPSKTFNLAGLQVSNIFIPNDKLRQRFLAAMDRAGYSQLNALGLVACEAAYTHGQQWLDQVRQYIYANIQFVEQYFRQHIPQIKLVKPEGTYLLWLDCSSLEMTAAQRERWLLEIAGLWLDDGSMFGSEGNDFERLNVACSRATLQQGLDRLRDACGALKLSANEF